MLAASFAVAALVATLRFASSGRYIDTGSESLMRPSSTSIMAATLVSGLVIE
jgi:hypothetical protein